MSDLRAIAETIKASRDERQMLTKERVQLIAKKRGDTKNLLAHFAEAHQRLSKQDAQARAAELNTIRARTNAIQAEAKGLVKTFEHKRQEMAQTLLQEAKALRQKLAGDNQARLQSQKNLMDRINKEHQAIRDTVRSIATGIERQLKTYEQTRRDGRDAWNQLLGVAHAQTTLAPATDTSFAIKIPFAPSQKEKRK